MYKFVLGLLVIVNLMGCNNSGGGGSGSGASTNNQSWNSYLVATESELPTCGGEIVGRLYYLESTNNFKVCKTTGWVAIDIKGDTGASGTNGSNGANGITVSGRWGYHVDSYVSSPELAIEAADASIRIGDIQLIKFSDNSCLIQVSGIVYRPDSGTSDMFANDFSHSYFEINCSSEKSLTRKIDNYANTTIRYKYDLSLVTPSFKAVVDIDGNYSNNTDLSFTIIQL